MIVRTLAVVLLSATFVLADATTQPSTQPTTQPSSRSSNKKFPTPAELIRKMKQNQVEEKQLPKVAYFDLSGPVVEKPAGFTLFGDDNTIVFQTLLDRLHKAKDDKAVRAVLITLGDSQFNFAQAQELRDALSGLRQGGKRTFVYADSYDTVAYTVASGATDVCVLGGGEIMIPGVGLETMFAKGFLDKVGVQADYIQIGEYKGADESMTRTTASDELRGELTKLTDSLYEQIVDGISLNRNLPKQAVKAMIDETMLNARSAKDRGFVDYLTDADGLRDLIAKELGAEKINLLHDYGKRAKESVDLTNPFAFLSMLTKKHEVSDKPTIAIISASGVIVDGDSGDGLFGGGNVGSDDIRKACRLIERDENIKAAVIRIDSPGGSALASEVMWQAVRRLSKTKPVIISVGGMAASGGYYLLSAGDYAFADPAAIVGSIGVVGGKFVFKGLFDKLGINNETFQRGRNAGLFSINQPFDERQRRMVTNWMRQTYDQFTDRILTTRGSKIKDIDQIARGRIFAAKQAKDLGMVDEIGGIEKAIAYAAGRVKLSAGDYDVRFVPPPKTIGDLLTGNSDGADAAMRFRPTVSLSPDSILRTLPPRVRQMLSQQIQMLQLLQDRPVMLVSPYVISIR